MTSKKEILKQINEHVAQLKTAVANCIFLRASCQNAIATFTIEQIQTNQTEYNSFIAIEQRKRDDAIKAIEAEFNKKLLYLDKQILEQSKLHQDSIRDIKNRLEEVNQSLDVLTFEWNNEFWKTFKPITDIGIPYITRLGMFEITSQYSTIKTPALLPIIGGKNVLIKASGNEKDQALKAMQNLMLRLLVTLPPGKLRYTLIDPVGLGANMAGFMNLPEDITSGKIWTESNHIERQLADFSAHIEMVIQKYLLNRYETMEQYNNEAGEVAEPYRLLVVANFPVNFTDQSAQRLISIASNGPRTGVYTIVVMDNAQKSELYKFNIMELERQSNVIEYKENRFIWLDKDHGKMEMDGIPDAELFNKIVGVIGEESKKASVVEVPFEKIVPECSKWWTNDASHILSAPIGKVGAKDIQLFEIGKGTEQHALVAGRTGSGKSNLLHVLILSLAMTYSPDEMQFYLIDFKKGVEFKDYAVYKLPHARVIAIQSEREFGLSVLQGLDKELQRRGDLFRDMGVANLSEYRQENPQDKMPRILLLVDEFQEFFTEDDILTGQISLFLDRLVRQGRAFGMHVLLASQSLSGSYNLPRATMNQMAIRIALQCQESDSHIILGDDNPAARLLGRPGEAIYNSANGLIEGNKLFQVTYLSADSRKKFLLQIKEYAEKNKYKPKEPQIVFEGNEPSKIETNIELSERLIKPYWDHELRAIPVWLGEPVAIKSHTASVFQNQSRSNLLIVGQNEKGAIAMLSSAIISIASHQSPEKARFYIINLSQADSDWYLVLPKLSDILPHNVNVGRSYDIQRFIGEIAEVVKYRSALGNVSEGETIYLVIAGIQRARDLRNADIYEDSESTAGQLSTILRDGPDLGIHTIIYCDTYNNLERSLNRQDISELGMRVAMRMSANDSNNCIDSPAASKLDQYLAFFFDEERSGVLEKFRPYDLPSINWFNQASETLMQAYTVRGKAK